MKKLSLVTIVTVLAAPAFAGDVGVSVGPNFSQANGVNIGSVTNIGINNLGAVVQNVGVVGGGAVHLDQGAINQEHAHVDIAPGAFTIGSLVGSGNGGTGGDVHVIAVNAAVALSDNSIDQGGVAAAVAIPVAVAGQGVALQDANHNFIPVNAGVGVGRNSADATGTAVAVQGNLASQKSITLAGAAQSGVGNGIDANGGNGAAFIVTIGSNNTNISNTSVSKIDINSTVNVADKGGVAGGKLVEGSFNTADFTNIDVTKINDSFNGNAVAVGDSTALSLTANGNKLGH